MIEFILEAATDALFDNLRMLPFLLIAFLILEGMEHYSGNLFFRIFQKRGGGPAAGALLGCIPQCGFSALISSPYCGGMVTLGTLLAVYLSTSDEAVLILLTRPGQGTVVGRLLLTKLLIAIPMGYLVDFFWNRTKHRQKHVEDLCEHCGCHENEGILWPAVNHTVKLFAFLLVFSFLLNMVVEGIGTEAFSKIMLRGTIFQPLITALIGLLPNCSVSVLMAQLYLDGIISFGSAAAGLCAGAGTGLVVLFRTNRNMKENLQILGILYVISALAGLLLQMSK